MQDVALAIDVLLVHLFNNADCFPGEICLIKLIRMPSPNADVHYLKKITESSLELLHLGTILLFFFFYSLKLLNYQQTDHISLKVI